MLNVAVVEDNEISRNLLQKYLEKEEIKIHALYSTGEEALEKIPQNPLPDVVLMDIGLPDISGIEVTRRLKKKYPHLDIIVQTVFEDTKTIIAAIKAGAGGYILKGSSRQEIIQAIHCIRKGESFLTPKVARKVLQEFRHTRQPAAFSLSEYQLTEQETRILEALVTGESYKEIAENMSISIHTVNNHIRHIYEKLQVHSRGEAVAKATGR